MIVIYMPKSVILTTKGLKMNEENSKRLLQLILYYAKQRYLNYTNWLGMSVIN